MPTHDTAWPAGTPCWVDYSAEDIGAAKEFYAAVLGWSFTEGQAEFGGYLRAEKTGRATAGLMPKMELAQPSLWTTYFATDDSTATADAITAAGGQVVVPPMQVGTLGTMTIAVDPTGTTFGTWQAGDFGGLEIYNEPGSLVWNEAAVADPEAARAFYAKVFGFRWDAIPDAGDYHTFTTSGDPLGGLGGQSPGSPQGWQACFSVASTDDAVAAAEAGGGKIVTAPHDSPWGRFAVVEDPWGAAFELMSAPAEAE